MSLSKNLDFSECMWPSSSATPCITCLNGKCKDLKLESTQIVTYGSIELLVTCLTRVRTILMEYLTDVLRCTTPSTRRDTSRRDHRLSSCTNICLNWCMMQILHDPLHVYTIKPQFQWEDSICQCACAIFGMILVSKKCRYWQVILLSNFVL